jgi:O-antigen/teichoic acid export membrane protein
MQKFIALCLAVLIATSSFIPAHASDPVSIFYAGPDGAVRTALDLIPEVQLVSDPAQAGVFVLNGTIPDAAELAELHKAGAGIVLLLGPDLEAVQVSTLLGIPLELRLQEDAISINALPGIDHPLLNNIVWNSAPQVRERKSVLTPISSITPLVAGFETGDWILWQSGSALVFNGYLDNANPQFQEWAYFNYLIYALTQQAAGKEPLSFALYPASPVPHANQQIALYFLLIGLLTFSVLAFVIIRRYSAAHPEALDVLVTSKEAYSNRQESTDWEEVGFHRPLGGFMLAFMLGLLMFIPLIIYQNLILPVYILPSAQALGIWGRVVQFFNFLWLLLDMGTSAAFIKFFAQYRVHDPRKAVMFGQIFVWWQALSGAVQVALVVFFAGTWLPQSVYALYTWSVIIHTIIQLPGFFQVGRHALMSWQRFDYAQLLIVGTSLIFPTLAQPILVSIMVAWGRTQPIFGPAMGGLFGLGLAAYMVELLTFLGGIFLYRRLGYNVGLFFMAHFDWKTIKQSFRFGFFEMAGSFAWAIGQAMEILITQTRLVNYTEIWGNWGLAQNFIFAFNVAATLYDNVMPSISEAISTAHRKLSQYYTVMSYKWGGLISAFIGAVLLAVADRFILGASGPEFARAAKYAIPLIIWGAIQYPSWVGDCVQLGSNRPYLKAALVAAEQFVRIVLAWLLVARFQINALIIAYFVGLLSKGFVAYWINHRVCYPQRFYFWQSLGAPVLAGGVHYLLLRWVTGLFWRGDQMTSVLIFLLGILFSYPIFAFLYGLFGGWDDATLEELRQAVNLSGFMRRMAKLFWIASALGARYSPLHNRFPIDIRQEAMEEAHLLTAERVKII